MAEEFIDQGRVCSGSWLNRSRSALFAGGLSPCSAVAGDMSSFYWPVGSIFGGLASAVSSGCTEALLLGGGASNGIRTSDQSDFTFNLDDIVHETRSSESSQIHNDWKPAKDHEDSSPTFLFDQSPPLPGDRSDLLVVDCSSQRCFDNLFSASFEKQSSLFKPINSSLPNPPRPSGHHFSNDTLHQNASMLSLDDIRASLVASPQPLLATSSLDEELNHSNLIGKASSQYSQVNGNLEPPLKRHRIETPSPLPTFKVRKEKLGDRITALQQLVSPFGKVSTDRALKDTEKPKMDLRSRGLCLVPISSTFPFTSQMPTNFWTPNFGGSFL